MTEVSDDRKFGEEAGVVERLERQSIDIGVKSSPVLRWIGQSSLYFSIGCMVFAVNKGVRTVMDLVSQLQAVQAEISEMEKTERQNQAERETNKEVLKEKVRDKAKLDSNFQLDLPESANSLPEACDLLAWEGMENPRNRDVYGRLIDVAKFHFDGFTELQNLSFLEACTSDGDTMRSLMNVLMIGAISDESREIAELVKRSIDDRCNIVTYVKTEDEETRFRKEYGACDSLPTSDFEACMQALNIEIPCFICRVWEEDPEQCKGLSKDSPKENCRTNVAREENYTDAVGAEAASERCKNYTTESWGITRQYEKMLRAEEDSCKCEL